MKTSIVRTALLGLAAGAIALLPLRAHAAATTPLAAGLYPAHTSLSVIAPLSNMRMDCSWAFICQDGHPLADQPLFHLTSEDDLHRVSGWAQFGQVHTGHGTMLFALYASRHADGQDAEGLPWSLRAFVDFRLTTLAHGFGELNHDPILIPEGVLGNSGAQLDRGSKQDILALAAWTGTVEVEAVAVYPHGDRTMRAIAVRDLTNQVRSAVSQGLYQQA